MIELDAIQQTAVGLLRAWPYFSGVTIIENFGLSLKDVQNAVYGPSEDGYNRGVCVVVHEVDDLDVTRRDSTTEFCVTHLPVGVLFNKTANDEDGGCKKTSAVEVLCEVIKCIRAYGLDVDGNPQSETEADRFTLSDRGAITNYDSPVKEYLLMFNKNVTVY